MRTAIDIFLFLPISYKIIQKLCMAAHVRSDLEQAGSAPLWMDPYTFCLSRSVRQLLNENQSNCAQDFLCASGRQQRELRAGNALSASPPVIDSKMTLTYGGRVAVERVTSVDHA
jgi:hypothetical protein